MNFHLIHLTETNSTNLDLYQRLQQRPTLPEGTVVYTDTQTAGRGQRGNSWESEPNRNLTFSILLKPKHIDVSRQFIISEIVSVGILNILERFAPGFSIKWPNDIYWNNKKIAGILIENDLMGHHIEHSIIGIGININQEYFLSSAPNPVSLKQITGKESVLSTLLSACLNRIGELYESDDYSSVSQRYRDKLYRKEGFHWFRSEIQTFKARIIDVETSGRLVLESPDGNQERFAFKEISFVI